MNVIFLLDIEMVYCLISGLNAFFQIKYIFITPLL